MARSSRSGLTFFRCQFKTHIDKKLLSIVSRRHRSIINYFWFAPIKSLNDKTKPSQNIVTSFIISLFSHVELINLWYNQYIFDFICRWAGRGLITMETPMRFKSQTPTSKHYTKSFWRHEITTVVCFTALVMVWVRESTLQRWRPFAIRSTAVKLKIRTSFTLFAKTT